MNKNVSRKVYAFVLALALIVTTMFGTASNYLFAEEVSKL